MHRYYVAMIMKILVASVNLLEPRCFATELVDLRRGATLNTLMNLISDHTL